MSRSRKIVTEKGVARKGGGRIAEPGRAEPKEKSWRKVMVSNSVRCMSGRSRWKSKNIRRGGRNKVGEK